MAYEKIGFNNGQILKAEDLNHIEEGIVGIQKEELISSILNILDTSSSVHVSLDDNKNILLFGDISEGTYKISYSLTILQINFCRF